jgi:hypothetical protein
MRKWGSVRLECGLGAPEVELGLDPDRSELVTTSRYNRRTSLSTCWLRSRNSATAAGPVGPCRPRQMGARTRAHKPSVREAWSGRWAPQVRIPVSRVQGQTGRMAGTRSWREGLARVGSMG